MAKSDRTWLWGIAIVAIAIVEVVGHVVIRAQVPEEADWIGAARYVALEFAPGDRVVAAPEWADPLVRLYFGELTTIADAGATDLAGVKRLWVVSIRSKRSRWQPDRDPDELESFGRVQVARWTLDEPAVIYDFVSHVRDATVEIVEEGQAKPCPWGNADLSRGGLDTGVMTPRARFSCDRRRRWLWVGPTVMEDLELRPRRCIWQHSAGEEPIRVSFRDVPVGDSLVVYSGVYYRDERMEEHGPATLRVFIDGEAAGELTQVDGRGWQHLQLTLINARGSEVEVRFETTARDPDRRSMCWSASMLRSEP